MQRLYYDPRGEGSFGGSEKLRKAVEKHTGKNPKPCQIADFLSAPDFIDCTTYDSNHKIHKYEKRSTDIDDRGITSLNELN